MPSDSHQMIPLRVRAGPQNKCLVCGSNRTRLGEYPSSLLGKYMHPPCRRERVREATKNHLSFKQWLEKCHPEIEVMEQKRLTKESDVNTPMAFWEQLSVKQLTQIEMAGNPLELSLCLKVSATRTPSCKDSRRNAMLRHDQALKEGLDEVAKGGFRAVT